VIAAEIADLDDVPAGIGRDHWRTNGLAESFSFHKEFSVETTPSRGP
jgi:hypothetical protein